MAFDIRNPQALLQPWRNLTQFTEELYSMLTRQGGAEPEPEPSADRPEAPRPDQARPRVDPRPGIPPTTIRARPTPPPVAPLADTPTRRADAAPRTPGFAPEGAPGRTRVESTPTPTPGRASRPYEFPAPAPTAAESAPPSRSRKGYSDPAPRADGAGGPYAEFPDYDAFAGTPVFPGGGGSGNGGLIGKVVEGGPGAYSVVLYPDGPNVTPTGDDAEPVTVTILTFHALDNPLQPDTWLTSIFSYEAEGGTTYFCQPPVWND